MSNEKATTGSNQTPPAIDGNTASKLERLLELLLVRESGALEREAAEKARKKAADIQREKNQTQNAYNLLKIQARCKHLKGAGRKAGKHETQNANRVDDPAVMFHRFIDGSMVIKCLLCHCKWKPNDTREFLIRNGGKKIPNVTQKSWEDALALVDKSSNTMTSSETITNLANQVVRENFQVPDGFEY